MNSTRAWIERKLTRPGIPSLDLALLTEHGLRFGMSRLSFVYVRALVRTAVHTAELLFMAREFPLAFAVPLFAMRALFGLGASLWWGPLEAVRRKVFEELKEFHPERARITIEAWSCIATSLGLGVCAWSAWKVTHAARYEWWFDGLYGSYLLVSAFTLTVDLWSRTIHAGAYALGRVYRPKWSMIVPDLLELGLIVGLWRAIGPFALAASVLVTSLLRSALTLWYTRRAYFQRKLAWPRFMRLRGVWSVQWQDLRVAGRGLLGSIPSQLDRVLLMTLLAAHPTAHQVLPIAAPYYALRPIAGVAQGWARTYYVDLIRVDSLSSSLFRARLERLLGKVGLIAGSLAGGTLIAGGGLMFGVAGAQAAAWLVPLCFLRSHFSVLQIRAIAYARVDALAGLSVAMVAVVLCTHYMHLSDRKLVVWVTVLLSLMGVVAGVAQRHARKRPTELRRLALGAWLADVCAQPGPVRVHAACVDTKLARPSAVTQQLLSAPGVVRSTRFARNWILWWEDGRALLPARDTALLLSGTCRQHVFYDAASGWDALNAACQGEQLPHELSEALSSTRSQSTSRELRERFAQEVPDGFVIDTVQASPGLSRLHQDELKQLRRALVAEAREQQLVPRRAPWQVAVYAPCGEPSLVFVWPAHTAGTGALRRSVMQAGWRDSLPRSLDPRKPKPRPTAAGQGAAPITETV